MSEYNTIRNDAENFFHAALMDMYRKGNLFGLAVGFILGTASGLAMASALLR